MNRAKITHSNVLTTYLFSSASSRNWNTTAWLRSVKRNIAPYLITTRHCLRNTHNILISITMPRQNNYPGVCVLLPSWARSRSRQACFFLFYQFWGVFSTTVQVVILTTASLGIFSATIWIQGRDATGYFTKLAALVTVVCFVLNVVMLGQIFNITPSDNALIPWAALALLLAYSCNLRLLLAVGILCIITFVSARSGTWGGMYWLDFGQRPENFFPVAFALFFAPQILRHDNYSGFASLYRIFGMLTLFLPMLILANWGSISYLHVSASAVETLYEVLGFVLSAAMIAYGLRRHWPHVINTGVAIFVIFLYTKFFDWWWDLMPKYLFFLIVALTAILFLVVLRRLRTMGYKVFERSSL